MVVSYSFQVSRGLWGSQVAQHKNFTLLLGEYCKTRHALWVWIMVLLSLSPVSQSNTSQSCVYKLMYEEEGG